MKSITEIVLSYPRLEKFNFDLIDSLGGLCIDTRKISSGDVFVGIIGERFDGNKFYESAINNGASCIVFDKKTTSVDLSKIKLKIPYFIVDDSVLFLQKVAADYVYSWKKSGGKVVCITGSNGKTTTKEMLSFFLNRYYKSSVTSTMGNLNNHIGVPLTLLSIKKTDKIAVVEIGTNAPGEISFLSQLAQPNFGIITSVGESHLEKLKNIEGVLSEKCSLFDYLNKQLPQGSVEKNCFYVLNGSLEKVLKKTNYSTLELGNDLVKVSDNEFLLKFQGSTISLGNSNIIGEYNFFNLSLAAIMSIHLGVPQKVIEDNVASFIPSASRSEWVNFKNKKVFCDYYNANPTSMINAIDAFSKYIGDDLRKCLFVIGDMYELGDQSESFHQAVALYLKKINAINVIFVGQYSEPFSISFGENCLKYQNSGELSLSRHLDHEIDYVFVKGSRGVQLEKIFIDDE
jgi:UDP-N-acetylmuramoyl-tripeptide--D-alanyl-D-alanine ligase